MGREKLSLALALACLFSILPWAGILGRIGIMGWFGYPIFLPAFLVVALFVVFRLFFLRSAKSRFDADDIFAMAGCMALFMLIAILCQTGMAGSHIMLFVLLAAVVFAACMLFHAFREGACERKKLAETENSASSVEQGEA